jgi:hypothetical protein
MFLPLLNHYQYHSLSIPLLNHYQYHFSITTNTTHYQYHFINHYQSALIMLPTVSKKTQFLKYVHFWILCANWSLWSGLKIFELELLKFWICASTDLGSVVFNFWILKFGFLNGDSFATRFPRGDLHTPIRFFFCVFFYYVCNVCARVFITLHMHTYIPTHILMYTYPYLYIHIHTYIQSSHTGDYDTSAVTQLIEELLDARKSIKISSRTVANCMQALRGDLDTIMQQVSNSACMRFRFVYEVT